jgi:hypothetical protein
MNSIILLIEYDTNGVYPLRRPVKAFDNWDWATLMCAKKNQLKTPLVKWYLEEIPFENSSANKGAMHFQIDRDKGELKITSDVEDEEVYVDITLTASYVEEYYHESQPPRKVPSFEIDSIKICGTDIDILKISEELTRAIKAEAENYKEEMIEELKNE